MGSSLLSNFIKRNPKNSMCKLFQGNYQLIQQQKQYFFFGT